jgi:hypothetical protein
MNVSKSTRTAQKHFAAMLFAKMTAIVEQPGYPLLTSYKNDLYAFDKAMIMLEASPDARFLWTVRENGTHLYRIGVHGKSNEGAEAAIRAGMTSTALGCELYLIEGDSLQQVTDYQARYAMRRMDFTISGSNVRDAKGQILASIDIDTFRKPGDGNNYAKVDFQLNSNRPVAELKYAVVSALRTIAIDESVSRCQSLFVRVESITLDGKDLSDAMDLAAERVHCETALEPA